MPELTPTIESIQGSVQIPVIQGDIPRVKEASELSSSDDVCILISDSTEAFCENLEALFADCKPVGKGDLVQLRASSVQPFKHVEDTKIGTRRLDIKRKTQCRN